MTPQEFIDVIRLVVRDAAVSDSLSLIEHPPGRKPSQDLREMAEWYQSLDADSRRHLSQVIALAVDSAVFGFLCVLDGVRPVEHVPPAGQFELRYVKDGVTLLNPGGLMLHDLY